ncbi:MAG TPA: hypothetical protein PLT25_11955 [Acidocella sp.]|nr:hypothetical protein [Acidocella sp.]
MAAALQPRALNTLDAAKYCGIKPARLRAMVKKGEAPAPIKMGQRQNVWLREVLDRWIDEKSGKLAEVSGNDNEWLAD